MAIPRNAYAPILDQLCRFIRMGDGIHRAGIEFLELEGGGRLRIYGKAVSVCQALHYRELIGLDLAFEALRTFLRQEGTARELEAWAGPCRIRRILTSYLEAALL
jgi:hypothetical protein